MHNIQRHLTPARISSVILSFLILTTAVSALAASVSLQWDPNDPAPEGYRVFARRSDQLYDYSQPDWEGNATGCTIGNLDDQTDYFFVVRAYDGSLESADSQEVHYTPADPTSQPPVAIDDSYTVSEGGTLSVAAAGGVLVNDSDPDGDALAVSLASGPASGTLTLNADGSFTYVHDSAETVSDTFTYTLSDGRGNTASAQAAVSITPVNDAPTAHAGDDQSVGENLAVTLDGSGSTDPDDSTLSFLWEQIDGPPAALSSANSIRPAVTAPGIDTDTATLEFRLTVRDSDGASGSDTCRVTVTGDTEDTTPPPTDPDSDNDGTPDVEDDDDDDDGMPDHWEVLFGLNPTGDDAGDDPDGDGINNRDEYRAGLEPDDPGAGTAPRQPTVASPASHAQVARNPVLKLEAYSDADGDAHIATQWQVYETSSEDCLLDVVSDRRLDQLRIPFLLLNGDRTYHWRVRFFDSGGRASQWSAASYLVTDAADDDLDGNGIPDDQEGGDVQADVTRSVSSPAGNCEPTGIAVASEDTISEIEQVVLLDPAEFEIDETTPDRLPAAMLAYKLVLDQPGQRALVTIHLSDAAPDGSTWFKYDAVDGWQDYSEHAVFSADCQSVTVEVKDGGHGDADGIANGIIVDPAGLSTAAVSAPPTTTSGDGGGGGGGGCFISTIRTPKKGSLAGNGPWQWIKGGINRLAGAIARP
ncbi:hypothetical protein DSCA_56130 [Desulfosarcina alkanivorans]|uniref:Fibronectin type-III domain-containing protein n=1 Tax=Desulfosarcina alkanivorans TaxID=571177 RepID=A0A5K7YUH1_9BACT|nr:fibronectin type III domain-containing protein [Desulfosarcina alkanivorans]BBO71683.1 hypothetical protein DSCA_56130 [Desulfosarcina alkanivorans]